MKEYYDTRAPEYDDWYLGRGSSPAATARAGRASSHSSSSTIEALPAGRTLDVALRDRVPHAAPARRGRRASTRARACSTKRRGRRRMRRLSRMTHSRCRSPTDSFDRVFTGHFYGHLDPDERARFLAESRRVADELIVVDAASCRDPELRGDADSGCSTTARVAGLQALLRGAGAGSASSAAATMLHDGPWFVVGALACLTGRASNYRSLASLQRDLRRAAHASRPASARVAARDRARRGPARVSVRPGARHRRGRRATTVARPRGHDAAPLARARRGRVLRDVLLRVGDALLPGPSRLRSRRPHADAGGAALCALWRENELALLRPRLIVTVGGLAARRLLGLAQRHRVRRQALRARRRRRRDPAATPFGRERLAERTREPRARRRRRRARRAELRGSDASTHVR